MQAIARRVRPGGVRIGAALVSGALRLEVEDDGAEGLPDIEGHGIGLANTRARLEALYGGDASLSVEATQAGGTRVVLRLPRLQGSAARLQQDHLARGFHHDEATVP